MRQVQYKRAEILKPVRLMDEARRAHWTIIKFRASALICYILLEKSKCTTEKQKQLKLCAPELKQAYC